MCFCLASLMTSGPEGPSNWLRLRVALEESKDGLPVES